MIQPPDPLLVAAARARAAADRSWGPKASRVCNLLLSERTKAWGVVELAERARIAPSYAVKILFELVGVGWVRHVSGQYVPAQPRSLLDSWAHATYFGADVAVRRFVVAGDATEVESKFVEVANRLRARYALTLFSGARRRDPFVRYPPSHAYLEGDPTPLARELGSREISEGGNLVLVEPEDEGVFYALQDCQGARVVSDARLYVDLFNFEARGREQAEFLLDKVMPDLRTEDSPAVVAAFHEALKTRDEGDRAILESRWPEAVELWDRALLAFKASPSASAVREALRARLLLWMSLAHVAFDRRDRKTLDKARAICTTESEVEELRRVVGYNATHVGLAILAFFAAHVRLTKDSTERRAYAEKARDHYTIITSPYAESHQEVAQAAADLWREMGADA